MSLSCKFLKKDNLIQKYTSFKKIQIFILNKPFVTLLEKPHLNFYTPNPILTWRQVVILPWLMAFYCKPAMRYLSKKPRPHLPNKTLWMRVQLTMDFLAKRDDCDQYMLSSVWEYITRCYRSIDICM